MKFGYAWTFVNKPRGGTPAPPPVCPRNSNWAASQPACSLLGGFDSPFDTAAFDRKGSTLADGCGTMPQRSPCIGSWPLPPRRLDDGGLVRNRDRIGKLTRPEIRLDVPHLRCRLRQRRGLPRHRREQQLTGKLSSLLTILKGSSKSVSFVKTAARSNSPLKASRTRCTPRLTSEPFSSVFQT